MKKMEDKTTSPVVETVRYIECQRNHVAFLGGYAVDGCQEFLASGEQGMAALTCHACGCHKSFHRREVDYEVVCDFSPTSET